MIWKNPSSPSALFGACAILIVVFLLALLFCTAIIMGVWNWILVPNFDLEPLSWGQALLLYFGLALVGSAFKTYASK